MAVAAILNFFKRSFFSGSIGVIQAKVLFCVVAQVFSEDVFVRPKCYQLFALNVLSVILGVIAQYGNTRH